MLTFPALRLPIECTYSMIVWGYSPAIWRACLPLVNSQRVRSIPREPQNHLISVCCSLHAHRLYVIPPEICLTSSYICPQPVCGINHQSDPTHWSVSVICLPVHRAYVISYACGSVARWLYLLHAASTCFQQVAPKPRANFICSSYIHRTCAINWCRSEYIY